MPYDYNVNFNTERTSVLTSSANFISPTRFRLAIDTLKYPNTQFFVTTVQMPDISISGAPYNTPKRNIFSTPDKIEYSEILITFLIDENMLNYREMHDWIFGLVNEIDTDNKKTRDMNLIVLNSNNNPIQEIKFSDAFPVNLSGPLFDVSATDTTYLTASVNFNFSYYKFV